MAGKEALAFDLYGTLVNPISIGEQLDQRSASPPQSIVRTLTELADVLNQ
jgi:hypothetical protein